MLDMSPLRLAKVDGWRSMFELGVDTNNEYIRIHRHFAVRVEYHSG